MSLPAYRVTLAPRPPRGMIEGAMTAAREDSRTAGARSGWAGSGWSDPRTPPASPRILLVDDEPQISGFVGRALERAGYHLVILDLIMPDMDGRAALAAILRAHPAQSVLILSCSSDPATKVECLDLGAKDYLTKPFSLAELTARVRARLRENAQRSEVMQVGELTLDAGRLVAYSGTGPVALTRLEFLCLRALMEHGRDSVTKSELLASVWGIEFDPGSNIVDVCIRRLRAKLGFTLIETVRGEGYRLAS